jgi:hypothetical protein
MKVVAMLGTVDEAVLRVAHSLGEVTTLAISPSADLPETAGPITQRIRVWDEALGELPAVGSDREAVLATVFAAAARRLDAQLFVIAETSIGYLGSAVAEQLNLAHLSQVVQATLLGPESATSQLRVMRRCLHGVQKLRGPAAAVLCVLPGAAPQPADTADEPKPGVAVDETVWTLADIGLVRSELPRPLVRVLQPAQSSGFAPRRFDSVESLAARLRQDGLG